MLTIQIKSNKRIDFIDITTEVRKALADNKIIDGAVVIYVPHTTCGVTINEGTDPDVPKDIQFQLTNLVPYQKGYRHLEGNSDSHIKTTLVGSSQTVIINDGKLILGTWQSIFLCDFDGPRTRQVHLQILS